MGTMRTSPKLLAASAASILLFASARPAHALGPVDLEIAGKVGYGSNQLDLGLGGRAGVSLFGLYGGLNIVDYLGQNSVHALTYGGELGYGFKISFITIRPLVGFGDESVSVPAVAVCPPGANCGSGPAVSSFYLQPGGLVQFGFGHLIFGVDAGALIPTASGSRASFTMNGELGVRF
jgi:hypothetical protein